MYISKQKIVLNLIILTLKLDFSKNILQIIEHFKKNWCGALIKYKFVGFIFESKQLH